MRGAALLLLFSVIAVLAGCSRATDGVRIVQLWSDQPLLALYAELYNASHEETKVQLTFHDDVAEAFLTQGGNPDLVIGRGLANRNLSPFVQDISILAGSAASELYPELLDLGRYDGVLRFLPLSFDLPALRFLETTLPESSSRLLTPAQLREVSEAFNESENGRFSRMGFSPLWDERFLLVWAQAAGTNFTEIEELRAAWDGGALEHVIEEASAWRSETNGGEAAEAFQERYLYDPIDKLLRRGRIGFGYTTGAGFLSKPAARRDDMQMRWLLGEDGIPVLPEIVYAAIPGRRAERRGAIQFLNWLLDPEVQRSLMETTLDRRVDAFGFLDGFSSLPEVNRQELTELFPSLLGWVPPESRLDFPRQTPLNWSSVEREVVGPWLRRTIKLKAAPSPREPEVELGEAIDQWYRARGL